MSHFDNFVHQYAHSKYTILITSLSGRAIFQKSNQNSTYSITDHKLLLWKYKVLIWVAVSVFNPL